MTRILPEVEGLTQANSLLEEKLGYEEQQVTKLEATNNSQITTIRELRAELSKTKDTAVDTIRELRSETKAQGLINARLVSGVASLKSHAASLAGVVEWYVNGTWCDELDDQARAALTAYRDAQETKPVEEERDDKS